MTKGFAFEIEVPSPASTDRFENNPIVLDNGSLFDHAGKIHGFEVDGQRWSGSFVPKSTEHERQVASGALVLDLILRTRGNLAELVAFDLVERPPEIPPPQKPDEHILVIRGRFADWRPAPEQRQRALDQVVQMMRDSAIGVRFNVTLAGGAIVLSANNLQNFPAPAIQWLGLSWLFLIISMISGIFYIRALPDQRNRVLQKFSEDGLFFFVGPNKNPRIAEMRDAAHHWFLVFGLICMAVAGITAALARL